MKRLLITPPGCIPMLSAQRSAVVRLAGHTALRELALAHNVIKEEGAQALAAAMHANRSVCRLELGGNVIGEGAAADLTVALQRNVTRSPPLLTSIDVSPSPHNTPLLASPPDPPAVPMPTRARARVRARLR